MIGGRAGNLDKTTLEIIYTILGLIVFLVLGFFTFIHLVYKKPGMTLKETNEYNKNKLETIKKSQQLQIIGDWSEESLRFKYLNYKINGIGNPKEFSSIICPNCFKSVLVKELDVSCPYCEENYGNKYSNIPSKIKQNVSKEEGQEVYAFIAEKSINWINEKTVLDVLYNQCPKCHRKIRFINCYHCPGKIDLFAPYDRNELERKSYG